MEGAGSEGSAQQVEEVEKPTAHPPATQSAAATDSDVASAATGTGTAGTGDVGLCVARLAEAFLAMVPVRHLPWPVAGSAEEHALCRLGGQQRLLQATLLAPLAVQHPPSCAYRAAFVKHIIARCEALHAARQQQRAGEREKKEEEEDDEQAVLDELYEQSVELIGGGGGSSAGGERRTLGGPEHCYKSYRLPPLGAEPEAAVGERFLTLRESTSLLSEGTTGLVAWEAAFVLADHLLQMNGELCRGRRLLELGCGVGLTGLVACMLQAREVVFTDTHPAVLAAVEANLALNHAAHIGRVRKLDWIEVQQRLDEGADADAALDSAGEAPPELMVGSDLCFDPAIVPCLAAVVAAFLQAAAAAGSAASALIACTERNLATLDVWEAALHTRNLRFVLLPAPPRRLHPLRPPAEPVRLYHIERNN